ncbi:Tyrosine kinase domain protein [Ceratobasidium sp. AG-Ba]|nr:Tyrosine kinase domain protein [Ceratobasidium sp. AG-Ba]
MSDALSGVPLPPGVEDITPRVQLYRVSRYQFQAAGVGGSADIFSVPIGIKCMIDTRGIYHAKNGSTTEVAVKCFRIPTGDDKDEEYEQKTRKKLIQELDIWQALNKTPHIVELFGVLQGVGPLPALVCRWCTWNLQSYLERINPPPKHIQMMTDTLQGLSYMHELTPDPVVHGDIKSTGNILVTLDERAIICDLVAPGCVAIRLENSLGHHLSWQLIDT